MARAAAWLKTAAGRAKTPGGWPGEIGFRHGFAGCCGTKCTLRAAAATGGGKFRKRSAAGGQFVLLVADAQREMVQGAAKDGVGAIIERLKWRHVAVPPHEHCRCACQVVGQLRRQSVGNGSVVSSGRVFGSTQRIAQENLLKVPQVNPKIDQVK